MGLYRFAMESSNDFLDYVEDYPESSAKDMIDDWKKRHPNDTSGLQLLHSFLEEHCPEWNSEPVSISSLMNRT